MTLQIRYRSNYYSHLFQLVGDLKDLESKNHVIGSVSDTPTS
jgi:hypothetical protein